MNLQQAQVNVNLLKQRLETATDIGVKAILMSQIKRFEHILNQGKREQADQFWKDLEAKYAQVEAEPVVAAIDEPKKRGRKAKTEVNE